MKAQDARDRHRKRSGESAGHLYLRALTIQERAWMERMVAGLARRYHVDKDDLLQDLHLSLLTCDSIDGGRESVRAWLTQRARWRAADLLARNARGQACSLDAVPFEPEATAHSAPDPDWSVDRIRTLGLNRDEAQVVLLILWGIDISLRDFAELAERRQAKIRQDKSRGLNKIRDLFGLDPAESAAVIAYRRSDSVAEAALSLHISSTELHKLLRRAHQKIDRALESADRPRTVRRPEGEADAV